MQSFCWNVLNDRRVYERLVEEIQQAELSEMVSFDEAQKNLPYFQACLKEAMRLQPAVGLNIYRKVPVGGAEIDGVRIPGVLRLRLMAGCCTGMRVYGERMRGCIGRRDGWMWRRRG